MPRSVRVPFVGRQVRLFHLVAFAAILVASVGAYAGSVTVASTYDVAYQGAYLSDSGAFSIGTFQYNTIQSAQSATSQAMTWSNGANAYVNAQSVNDWELFYVLTINAGAATSHTYTITVTSTASDGAASTIYTFQFTTPASITAGQTMNIIWDTGSTSWTAPSALQVTIA